MDYILKCNGNEYLFNVSKKVKNANKVLLDYISFRYDNSLDFKHDIDNATIITIQCRTI